MARAAFCGVLAACLLAGSLPVGQAQSLITATQTPAHRLYFPWVPGSAFRVYLPLAGNAGSDASGLESCAAPATGAGASAGASPAAGERRITSFVTREGAGLYVDGQPYTFVGVNVSYLAGPFFAETDAEPIIAFLAANGVQVIRVWVEPWIDLARVGRMLDLGGKYGVRFVLTLQNFFNHETGNWFSNLYSSVDLPHIANIVPMFADRPEILAWELMNEPTCPPKDSGQACWDAFVHWAEVTSQAIKALDARHLVSVGTLRGGFDSRSMDAFRRVHALDAVDLVSIHCEANKMPEQEFGQELAIARELGKPVFFGEVALAGRPGNGQSTPKGALYGRAQEIAASIERSRQSGIVGYLLWQYAHGPVDLTNPYDYFDDDPVWDVLRASQGGD